MGVEKTWTFVDSRGRTWSEAHFENKVCWFCGEKTPYDAVVMRPKKKGFLAYYDGAESLTHKDRAVFLKRAAEILEVLK